MIFFRSDFRNKHWAGWVCKFPWSRGWRSGFRWSTEWYAFPFWTGNKCLSWFCYSHWASQGNESHMYLSEFDKTACSGQGLVSHIKRMVCGKYQGGLFLTHVPCRPGHELNARGVHGKGLNWCLARGGYRFCFCEPGLKVRGLSTNPFPQPVAPGSLFCFEVTVCAHRIYFVSLLFCGVVLLNSFAYLPIKPSWKVF